MYHSNSGQPLRSNPLFLFVPTVDTHAVWMMPIALKLESSRFMILPQKVGHAGEYLSAQGIDFERYEPGLLARIRPDVVVLAVDWAVEEQQVIAEAKFFGIPVVCIQEGLLIFNGKLTGVLAFSDYVFLQGPEMVKYLDRDGLFVTGNPKYDGLEELPFPAQPGVMINSNFAYRFFDVEYRQQWIEDVTAVCRDAGVPFFISQHPRDFGDFMPGVEVIHSTAVTLKSQLERATILISRGSTVIYEAVAVGRKVIYYNPGEAPCSLVEDDDTGLILIARSRVELQQHLQSLLSNAPDRSPEREDPRKEFLSRHLGTQDHLSGERCAARLREIAAYPEKFDSQQFFELLVTILKTYEKDKARLKNQDAKVNHIHQQLQDVIKERDRIWADSQQLAGSWQAQKDYIQQVQNQRDQIWKDSQALSASWQAQQDHIRTLQDKNRQLEQDLLDTIENLRTLEHNPWVRFLTRLGLIHSSSEKRQDG